MLFQLLDISSEEFYHYITSGLEKNYFLYLILFIFLIILYKKWRKKDKKEGTKGAGIASFLTSITKIFLVVWIAIIWIIKLDIDLPTQILLLGVPFSLIYLAESTGIWDGIKSYFQGLFIGGVLLIVLQLLRILTLSTTTIFFIEKIISTISAIIALKYVGISRYREWYRKRPSTSSIKVKSSSTGTYKSSYPIYSANPSSTYNSGYNSYHSSSSTNLDLFGCDTRVEYNSLTGKNEYYQNGKLIARGEKSPFSGNENIYDTNGNKILTKEQGFFDDYVYKDKYGNTKYKESTDFLFGSSVYDNNYHKVAQSDNDIFDDFFGLGKNYTSRK